MVRSGRHLPALLLRFLVPRARMHSKAGEFAHPRKNSCVFDSPCQRSPGPGPRKGVGMPTVGSCHVSPGKQRIISCRSASPPRCAGGHGRGKLTESDRRLKDGKKPTEGSYRVSPGNTVSSVSVPLRALLRAAPVAAGSSRQQTIHLQNELGNHFSSMHAGCPKRPHHTMPDGHLAV